MDFHFANVPNYLIKGLNIKRNLKDVSQLKSVNFLKIILNDRAQYSIYKFENLKSLVDFCDDDIKSAYNFVDFELNDGSSFFNLIDINRIKKTITFFSQYNSLPNKWRIFLNAKDNIVVDDPFYRIDDRHIQLKNNKYYSNVDFYIGISSLIEIVKNAKKDEHFEDIISQLNEANETLSELASDVGSRDIFENIEQDYLKNLVGLENVKQEISVLKAHALISAKKISRGIPVESNTLHMVFTGNPGTGKTTVARLIGKIYKDLGLLESGHLIEVTSGELEAQHVGHTAPKTTEIFEKAINGVLFIDEAYSLLKSGNNFGREVIETLLKLMEDNRENIVVIFAGYTEEIEKLLESNPGLKDRFSTIMHFDDYTKEELKEILLQMVINMKHKLSSAAICKFEFKLDEYFDKGYFKSNARKVRNIFEKIQKSQSVRLSKVLNPTDEELRTFIDLDVPETFT